MSGWHDQNKPLYEQPIQWRKGVAITLGLACMMFSYAIYIWISKADPCGGGTDKWCKLAEFWAKTIGVPVYLADAQRWAALGLLMICVAWQLWKHRADS